MSSGPNWARRFGTQSPRLCARPGCAVPAVATLRFERTRREASIVDLDGGAARAGDLCHRHATVVALPRGWSLADRRTAPLTPVTPPALVEAEVDIAVAVEVVEVVVEVLETE